MRDIGPKSGSLSLECGCLLDTSLTEPHWFWRRELRNVEELRHVKVDPEPSVLVGSGTSDATTTGTHGSTTPLGTQALTSDVRPPLALHLDHAGSVSTAAGHFRCHHTLL